MSELLGGWLTLAHDVVVASNAATTSTSGTVVATDVVMTTACLNSDAAKPRSASHDHLVSENGNPETRRSRERQ